MSLKLDYYNSVRDQLKKSLKIENQFAVAQVTKIVVNVGAGEALTNKNVLNKIVEDLSVITGQKPVITKARRSVAGFKIRKGVPIGVKVTLRGARMYDFLEKIIRIILPRIRDFRGIPIKSFDGRGNLNIGINDQTLFPEIDYDKIDRIRGLEITVVTSAKTDQESQFLLKLFGFPFSEEKK